jgi:hypothetical protein
MKTNKTRIAALAALLAVIAASAPLWAQEDSKWPAWQTLGFYTPDLEEWVRMGDCWKGLTEASRIVNNSTFQRAADELGKYANNQEKGVEFWKKNKNKYQKRLAAAQKAAQNIVYTVTAADVGVSIAADGSAVAIWGYYGSAPNIFIPAELEGLPVRSVRLSSTKYEETGHRYGGYGSYRLRQQAPRIVTIADGISMADDCFFGLVNLESLTLPQGIKAIAARMFLDSPSLTSLTIPASVTEIGDYAVGGPGHYDLDPNNYGVPHYRGCGIKELVIPDSVVTLGKEIFSRGSLNHTGISAIERITLPKNLKEIPKGMFRGAKNLKSITLPEGLTAIGEYAFSESGLESIVIPDSVTVIGNGAFSECENLAEVTLPKGLKSFPSYWVYDYSYNTGTLFDRCSRLKRITIPAGVSEIGGAMFDGCTALEEITFWGNTSLPFDFTPGLRTSGRPIGRVKKVSAFFSCPNIKRLIAGPGVTKIKGVENIPGPNTDGLSLKEAAERNAEWHAFVEKYK